MEIMSKFGVVLNLNVYRDPSNNKEEREAEDRNLNLMDEECIQVLQGLLKLLTEADNLSKRVSHLL